MNKEELAKIALGSLRQKARLSAEEIETRLVEVLSKDYWQQLNPQLTVCENNFFAHFEIEPLNHPDQLLNKLEVDGYFQTTPLIDQSVIKRMRDGIENIRKAGLPAVFSFMYDEFWQITRTPSLINFLSGALGENYHQLPHTIVHYVHTGIGSGWYPHVDFAKAQPHLTVWISLGDATLDNGCMYVIPRQKVDESLLNKWENMEELTHIEVTKLLHYSRALPAPTGSVLGWYQNVIHWGAPSNQEVEPRISLSIVLLPEDVNPAKDELPLLDKEKLPTFNERLFCVGMAFYRYSEHQPSLDRFWGLGKRMINESEKETVAQR